MWHYEDSIARTLRRYALWYPKIPDESLNLHEDSFVNWRRHTTDLHFRPLFWTHFGGPKGIYLKHLLGLRVLMCPGKLLSIQYDYDNSVAGLRRSYEDRLGADGYQKSHIHVENLGRWIEDDMPDEKTAVRFSIDGPGGEYINAIELHFEPTPEDMEDTSSSPAVEEDGVDYEPIVFVGFGLSTNKGNWCNFSPWPHPPEGTIRRMVTVAPGTAVTGFYSSKVSFANENSCRRRRVG